FEHDAALENANIALMIKPTFDLTYENAGFKETPSISRASNQDYAEAREWSPIASNKFYNQVIQPGMHNNNHNNNNNNNTVVGMQASTSNGGQYIKKKHSSSAINSYPMHSYAETSHKSY